MYLSLFLFNSMMFGIGTKNVRLHINVFKNLLGEDEHGWGLSHKGYYYFYRL